MRAEKQHLEEKIHERKMGLLRKDWKEHRHRITKLQGDVWKTKLFILIQMALTLFLLIAAFTRLLLMVTKDVTPSS